MSRRGLGALAAVGLAALSAACSDPSAVQAGRAFGDPVRGKVVVGRQACGSCHIIPGLEGADGLAGPPLTHFARRTVVAGMLPNTPEDLARWLKSPQAIVPGNAMPDVGLSDQEARDAAAFLQTLR